MGEGYTTAINFHLKIQSIEEIPVLPFKPVRISWVEFLYGPYNMVYGDIVNYAMKGGYNFRNLTEI